MGSFYNYTYNDITYIIECNAFKGHTTFNNMLDPWREGDKFVFSINSHTKTIVNKDTLCVYYPLSIYYIIEDNINKHTLKIEENDDSYNIYILIKDYSEQDNDYYVHFTIKK